MSKQARDLIYEAEGQAVRRGDQDALNFEESA